MARQRLTPIQHGRLVSLVRAGDPRSEVGYAYSAKEVVRQIYEHTNPQLADEWVAEIVDNFCDESMPPEIRRLGRTISKWATQITAWHQRAGFGGGGQGSPRLSRISVGSVREQGEPEQG